MPRASATESAEDLAGGVEGGDTGEGDSRMGAGGAKEESADGVARQSQGAARRKEKADPSHRSQATRPGSG
ncbi:MAG: hypothetical protein WBE86_05090 [Candidatus Acidiferrales bacterium]